MGMGLPLEKLEKFVCEMENQSIEVEIVYAHVDQNYAIIAIAPDKDTVDLMIGIVGFKKDGTNESNFITKKLQRPCSSVAINSCDYEFAKKYLVPASRPSGGYGPNAGFNLFIFLEKNLPEHPTKRYKRRSEICKVFARDDQLAKCIEDPDKTLFCGFYPNHSPNSVSPRNQEKTYMTFGEEGLQFSLRHNLSTCWTNDPVRAEKAEERYKGLLDSFKNKTTKRYVENKDPHFWEKTF